MKKISSIIISFILALSTVTAQDFSFTPITVLNGLSDNQVRYIIQLPDGRMVFKTSGNINLYDGTSFKYIHQDEQQTYSLKGYDGFYRIYLSGDSLLWIKDHHKLMCVDLRTEKYIQNLGFYFNSIGFKQDIDDVFLDSSQRLWLLNGGKLTLKDHRLTIDLSGNEGILQDLAAEKDKLYLFYNTGAVICYNLKSGKKEYSATAYPDEQKEYFGHTSLVVKGKDGFYQLRNGSKGGFFFFDPQKRNWKKILETSYALNTLVVDDKGTASISCANGIWIIRGSGKNKKYLPAILKTDGTKLSTEISTLLYDKQGGLWLGTVNQGLLYYHPNRYTFKQVSRAQFPKIAIKDIIVQRFAEDGQGNIYLKCQSEIYKYNRFSQDNTLLEAVDFSAVPPAVMKTLNTNVSSLVYSIHHTTQLTDIRGWKWTGTADGLKVFKPGAHQEHIFYTKDGLSNNFIQALLQDRHHYIWATTSYGITRIQVEPESGKIQFTSFRSNSGTLEGEYTQGSAFESADGTLFFGGINGFSVFEPDQPKPDLLPFRPLFTNLFLRGEKIEPGNYYDRRIILSQSPAYTKHIELSYNQNFLSFEFSALNYQNSSQTYYRYQLEGIDKQWQETFSPGVNAHANIGGSLSISYTNLSPGKYKLKVMASNTNLNWKGPVSSIYLTIHAPWWKTTTAYLLYAAFAFLIVFAVIYNYLRNVRKKLEREHREEILLIRIHHLIDQQRMPEAKKEIDHIPPDQNVSDLTFNDKPGQIESAFITRAMALVEKNLDVPDYSVEQLSRDLHMDRTGLYRKLITLLDKSPSLFIRHMRIEKAAAMLIEGELNISQIAEKVGFSSSSYLSKCFQEHYGCRPSEYAEKRKKST